MTTSAPAPAAKPRKPRYPATVMRVKQLTPHMVRVTFSSPELATFGWNGPAAHIKLIFGDPAATPRPTMRTYTPRRFDPAARELDVDFVLHGEGPASTWAAQAAVGQTLTIAGPGRSYTIDSAAPWFVLAGDESAIPAICTILEHLPPAAPARTSGFAGSTGVKTRRIREPFSKPGCGISSSRRVKDACTWPAKPARCGAFGATCSLNAAWTVTTL
jgi:NADPH-dependent ferric siderophore reductase